MKQVKFACFTGALTFICLVVFLFPVELSRVLMLRPAWQILAEGQVMLIPGASAAFIGVEALLAFAVGLICATFPLRIFSLLSRYTVKTWQWVFRSRSMPARLVRVIGTPFAVLVLFVILAAACD